jgi:hypothetical protein
MREYREQARLLDATQFSFTPIPDRAALSGAPG